MGQADWKEMRGGVRLCRGFAAPSEVREEVLSFPLGSRVVGLSSRKADSVCEPMGWHREAVQQHCS
jgi:hypothetical protein